MIEDLYSIVPFI